MPPFSPVDHKEKTPEDRAAVLAWVASQVGFEGTEPTSPAAFVGTWHFRFFRADLPDAPWFATRTLHADGTATQTATDGSFQNENDRWVLNQDGSFSFWSYVEPMPDYGIPEPTYSEDRWNARFRDTDTFILVNGDGSLIEYHERA